MRFGQRNAVLPQQACNGHFVHSFTPAPQNDSGTG
jgi:hypothetical protein